MTRTTGFFAVLLGVVLTGCTSGSDPVSSDLTEQVSADGGGTASNATVLPAMYSRFSGDVQVFVDGAQIVLRTDDLPNHPSPYYGQGSSMYEAPHAGMVVNPNLIATQDFELRVPIAPQVGSADATPLGAIGIAVNGVVLFNQYAGPGNQALDNEIATFDRLNGHPQNTGIYHYHLEPLAITAADPAALVGVLLDGFPVYGTVDQGGAFPVDLDQCNGHVGVTADFPDGISHYHVTAVFPYISGCYRGSAGSVTN